jgi:hypothetical protein
MMNDNILKDLKRDKKLYLKELADAVKREKWLEVIEMAVELQSLEDVHWYLFEREDDENS